MSSRSSASRCYPNPMLAPSQPSAGARGKEAEIKMEVEAEAGAEMRMGDRQEQQSLLAAGLVDMAGRACADLKAEHADPFLYEGVGGVAWMLLHISRTMSDVELHRPPHQLTELLASAPATALQFAERAAQLAQQKAHRSRHALPLTFFMGSGGVCATTVLAALSCNQPQVANEGITALLKLLPPPGQAQLPDEPLYGRTGLMHSMLLVHHRLSSDSQLPQSLQSLIAPLQQCIDQLFDEVVARGVAYPAKHRTCPMMWEWHGTKYLGAAHGVTGILYILMLAHWRFTAARDPSSRMRQLVLGTLDYCCSIRLPSGNFPSSEHDEEDYEPSDKLVQWCHGAPGLSFACIKAYELWHDAKYLQVARKSAEVVWQRGLLKKGVGLCHGIGGNGYVFLRLWDVSHDPEQLRRAAAFAYFAMRGPHVEELMAQPDSPSSLANGRAGFACFLSDLMAHMHAESAMAPTTSPASEGAPSSAAAAATAKVTRRACFPGMDLLP